MDKNLSNVLQQCKPLVLEVGDFMRSELYNVAHDDIVIKDVNSLVSYVDETAEKMLVKGLLSIIPESGFFTEEKTIKQSNAEYTWVIDPLDGTNNYLHQIPHFAISIGLQKDNETVLGIVYQVMSHEYFHAIKGGGAFLNDKAISVSTIDKLEKALLGTGFPYKNDYKAKPYIDTLIHWLTHSRGVRRFGSAALDLCYVACGRFDAYYESSLNKWDVVAGILIVEEAGGRVSNFAGEPCDKDGSQTVSSNGVIHDKVIEVLKSKFGETIYQLD